MESLRKLFVTPKMTLAQVLLEPTTEEDKFYKAEVERLLAEVQRIHKEMARDSHEPEPRQEACVLADLNALLEPFPSRRFVPREDGEKREQELIALRQENERLRAEVGRRPGWLFSERD